MDDYCCAFSLLPPEIWCIIFRKLNYVDLCSLCMVNGTFRATIQSDIQCQIVQQCALTFRRVTSIIPRLAETELMCTASVSRTLNKIGKMLSVAFQPPGFRGNLSAQYQLVDVSRALETWATKAAVAMCSDNSAWPTQHVLFDVHRYAAELNYLLYDHGKSSSAIEEMWYSELAERGEHTLAKTVALERIQERQNDCDIEAIRHALLSPDDGLITPFRYSAICRRSLPILSTALRLPNFAGYTTVDIYQAIASKNRYVIRWSVHNTGILVLSYCVQSNRTGSVYYRHSVVHPHLGLDKAIAQLIKRHNQMLPQSIQDHS